MASFLNPRGHKTAFGEYPTVSVDHGWPDSHLIARPRDPTGEAIIAYAKKWKDHPDFPESPWDTRRGKIYLPDLDQPRADKDPIPLYRLKAVGVLNSTLYPAGAEIDSPAWPTNPSQLEPVNEGARLVLNYMAKFGAGRNLTTPPYSAGTLHFENPALFGTPQNYTHRGTIGDPTLAA
jgi:hypothetical protein